LLVRFRERINSIIEYVAKPLHRLGITPMSATFLSAFCAVASGGAYAVTAIPEPGSITLVVALVFLFLAGFFDAVDGAIARLCGRVTKFGGFMDSVLDRVGESAVYAGAIFGGLCSVLSGLLALTTSLLVSYVRARGEASGVGMGGVGLAERAERLVILMVATALAQIEIGMLVIGVLGVVTIVQRVMYAHNELKMAG